MTDSLQVKEEQTSVATESRLPDLPSTFNEDAKSLSSLTLEQIVNSTEDSKRFELLNLYMLQLSKTEKLENDDVIRAANCLRKLIRSDNIQVQNKVAELLVQYLKVMKVNTEYDPKTSGIRDASLLWRLYQLVHEDSCRYLLPNVKAGESFNKFLCNFLSTCSSNQVFESVVKLFKRTVEDILSRYRSEGSSNYKNLSTEDTRVVIGIMKTLLTLTKAFGSPPAPRDLLCSLSVLVVTSTKAHLCTLYSYNLVAFLIKDVTEKDILDRLLTGLNSTQFNQVTSLVKESNSLNNTCNWRFKYSPSDPKESSVSSTVEVQKDVVSNKKRPLTTSNKAVSGSVMNSSKVGENKKQKTGVTDELPGNWYRELFSKFESNRGEGKSVVVDKNAWKWKNDLLLNVLKKLEPVPSVEVESVSGQFVTLFENMFKYESAIPVVINSLNLFKVLLVKGNFDFLSAAKSQLLSDMLFEKLKESNRKVRDACIQSLVETVKRCRLQVVCESVKKVLVNVSPNCRENICNFLNGKLVPTSDSEFFDKLQQLLSMLSEHLKQMELDKVPKVKKAMVSLLEVLDDFNLVYSNQSMYTSISDTTNSSLYGNWSVPSSQEVDVPNDSEFVKDSDLNEEKSVEDTITTTATSVTNLETTNDFRLDQADNEVNVVGVKKVLDPRTSMVLENLVDIVDNVVLEKFRRYGDGGLDDALYSLCIWMADNQKLIKSVDFFLLKIVNQLYESFTNTVTLDTFFSQVLSQPLSDEAFLELFDIMKERNELRVLSKLLSKNNTNTNKLLNPLNSLYYTNPYDPHSPPGSDVSSITRSNLNSLQLFLLQFLRKYLSDGGYVLGNDVVIKLTNFLVYFVKLNSSTSSRLSMDVLCLLDSVYNVSKYLDSYLLGLMKFSRPSKTLISAYSSSALRVEKYVSRDLFMCMFKSTQDSKKRACEYWKKFLSKGDEKSDNMLLGTVRKDLTSWLSFTLFENKCEKVVLDLVDLIVNYLSSRGLEFDEEESSLLSQSFCSYSTFGKYQSKALPIFNKMARMMKYSFDVLTFYFEFLQVTNDQWLPLLSEALVRIVRKSKPDDSLLSYVSKALQSNTKLTQTYKNLLRQWLDSFTPSPLTSNATLPHELPYSRHNLNLSNKTNDMDVTNVVHSKIDHVNLTSLSKESLQSKFKSDLEKIQKVESSVSNLQEGRRQSLGRALEEDKSNVVDKRSDSVVKILETGVASTSNVPVSSEQVVVEETSVHPRSSVNERSDFVIERLETVHQDHEPTLEPASTTESNYNSTSNFPSTSFFNPTQETNRRDAGVQTDIQLLPLESSLDRGNYSENVQCSVCSGGNKESLEQTVKSSDNREETCLSGTGKVDNNVNVLDEVILDEDVNLDLESCRRLSKQIVNTPTEHTLASNQVVQPSTLVNGNEVCPVSGVKDIELDKRVCSEEKELDPSKYEDEKDVLENDPETTISCTSRYNHQHSASADDTPTVSEWESQENRKLRRSSYKKRRYQSLADEATSPLKPEEFGDKPVDSQSHQEKPSDESGFERSSSEETFPSVVAEYDSESEISSSYEYGLSLVESVLSLCSKVNNVCLVFSYKEYHKLANSLYQGDVSKILYECSTEVLNYKNTLKGSLLKRLSVPLVEMCHNAVLLISRHLIKHRSDESWEYPLEALTAVIEVFKYATASLSENFVLHFCNVVTSLLALPKELFQNERLYCLTSSLVADNALKQSTEIMYKLLMVMVELSTESLEGELDRLLMAKLRFTKILQMQILLGLKNSGNENRMDSELLKSVHVDFIKKLEKFTSRQDAHGVEKVIQTSTYLVSTM